jgi:hypothetical protein
MEAKKAIMRDGEVEEAIHKKKLGRNYYTEYDI